MTEHGIDWRGDIPKHTTFFDDVKAFHVLFKLPVGEVPAFTSVQDQDLRMRLITEERLELIAAHETGDIVEAADAIADLIYVACGMAVSYGIPLNAVWEEVQRTNMAKVGPDGIPIYRADGKVAKPDGWQPPDIGSIIRRHGEPPSALRSTPSGS
jgi:predicted HAD superfamily Cof-like phosphohydrolase